MSLESQKQPFLTSLKNKTQIARLRISVDSTSDTRSLIPLENFVSPQNLYSLKSLQAKMPYNLYTAKMH